MAITNKTPYNPKWYSNIPANFRTFWASSSKSNKELTLTDEEIFIIWRDNYATVNEEGEDIIDEDYMNLFEEAMEDKEKEI